MSSFEDAIWAHLVDQHGADRIDFHVPRPRNRPRRLSAAAVGAVLLATAVLATVLVLTASTSAPPAYALTQVAGGTYTVSLNDIATGIPALNARFAELGIPETVVPVEAGCKASSFDPLQTGTAPMTQTITISARDIPPGYRGFIAAEQLPDGHVRLAQGTTAQPIPSCFPVTATSGTPGPSQNSP